MKHIGWLILSMGFVCAVAYFVLGQPSTPSKRMADDVTPGAGEAHGRGDVPALIGTGRVGPDSVQHPWPPGPDVIRVRVLDRQHRPVAGTPIRLSGRVRARPSAALPAAQQLRNLFAPLHRRPYVEYARQISDANGNARFAGLWNRGYWRVTALPSAPLCAVSRDVPPTSGGSSPRVIELILLEGVPLDVRLVDGAGSGISGLVSIMAPIPDRPDAPYWTAPPLRTGPEGRAHLFCVPRGTCTLRAYVPGHGERSRLWIDVPYPGEYVIRFDTDDPAEIFGRVLHPDGTPVAAAHLWLRTRAGGVAAFASEHEAESDAAGRYRITGIAGTRIQAFTASAPGHLLRHGLHVGEPLAPGSRQEFDVLLPQGCVLEGQVVDRDGRPLADASVQAYPRLDAGFGSTRWHMPMVATDAEGRFVLEAVPPGRGQLLVQAPGYRRVGPDGPPRYEIPKAGDRRIIRVVLLRGANVRGVVRDTAGQPAVAARVTLIKRSGPDWVEFRRRGEPATTDSEGRYVLSGFDPDAALYVRANSDSGWSLDVPVPKSDRAEGAVVDLRLRPGARVAGRLVTPDGGRSTARVLRLTMGPERFVREVSTGADGQFSFRGLPEGRAQVEVRGFRPRLPEAVQRTLRQDVTLTWGEQARPLAFELPRLGRIGGTVVDSEGVARVGVRLVLRPEPGAGVEARYAGSRHDGSFEFPDLLDRPYTLLVQGRAQGRVHIGERHLRITATRESTPGPVPRDFRGRVLLPTGGPLPGGRCTLFEAERGREIGRAPVRDGMFTIQVYSPDPPRVRVRIEHPVDLFGNPLNISPVPVELASPRGGLLDVHLAPGLVIAGRLLAEDGGALAPSMFGVTLIPQPAAPGKPAPAYNRSMYTRADPAGHFSFVGLGAGRWTLSVEAPGSAYQAPAALDVASGADQLEVRLRRGETIAGRLVTPDGAGAAGAMVGFSRLDADGRPAYAAYAQTAKDGSFEIVGVPFGVTGTLSGMPTGADAARYVSAVRRGVASGAAGLVLQLEAGYYISGRIDGSASPDHVPQKFSVIARASGAGTGRSFSQGTTGPGFRIGPLPAGDYDLELHLGPGFPRQAPLKVRAPARGVVFEIQSGRRVEGRLRAPQPGAFVVWWQWRGAQGKRETQSGRADADGRILLWVPADAAPGTLFVRNRRTGAMALQAGLRPADGPFLLTPTPGFEIRGRVVVEQTRRRRVWARGPVVVSGMTEADGRFTLKGLPAGRYDLSVETATGTARQVRVAAGRTDVILSLAPR